jgi:hypothetical protein
MPSVRIKRTDYSQLEDQTNEPPTFARALSGLFQTDARRPGSASEQSTTAPQTQSLGRSRRATVTSSPGGPVLLAPPRVPSPVARRPRAGSRVADHVMSRASVMGLRSQRSASSTGGGGDHSRRSSTNRRSPVPAGVVVMEGPQAEVHGIIFICVLPFMIQYLTGHDTVRRRRRTRYDRKCFEFIS